MTKLILWIEDFIKQIENPQMPDEKNIYKAIYNRGCYDTQVFIAEKLRYALEQEKKNAA